MSTTNLRGLPTYKRGLAHYKGMSIAEIRLSDDASLAAAAAIRAADELGLGGPAPVSAEIANHTDNKRVTVDPPAPMRILRYSSGARIGIYDSAERPGWVTAVEHHIRRIYLWRHQQEERREHVDMCSIKKGGKLLLFKDSHGGLWLPLRDQGRHLAAEVWGRRAFGPTRFSLPLREVRGQIGGETASEFARRLNVAWMEQPAREVHEWDRVWAGQGLWDRLVF